MTYSSPTKVFKQLIVKPKKLEKFKKHNLSIERTTGAAKRTCKLCGRVGAHIQKYDLGLCRHCFRLNATKIGFKKYS
jgi:small subunit ribosomal protein S14